MGVQRDGSFAEYVAMPIERIYPGKGLSAKELALIDAFLNRIPRSFKS